MVEQGHEAVDATTASAFLLPHLTVTGCSAALNPAELLSQATLTAEVSLDLPVWYGLDSLAVRTFFLRGKPEDCGAVGVSYLKSQSSHHWVQQGICPPQCCEYCSSHPE